MKSEYRIPLIREMNFLLKQLSASKLPLGNKYLTILGTGFISLCDVSQIAGCAVLLTTYVLTTYEN